GLNWPPTIWLTGPPTGPRARERPLMSRFGATRPPDLSVEPKSSGLLPTILANTCAALPMLLPLAAVYVLSHSMVEGAGLPTRFLTAGISTCAWAMPGQKCGVSDGLCSASKLIVLVSSVVSPGSSGGA